VQACGRLRTSGPLSDPLQAVKVALRRLARRHQHLITEIKDADAELHGLVATAAPGMTDLLGVGVEVVGQLLTTVGDNPQRMRFEAAFAHLCGVAPIPASSGKTRRHRLNRGGDRAGNNALYTVVLTRLRLDERTRRYVARRTTEGLSRFNSFCYTVDLLLPVANFKQRDSFVAAGWVAWASFGFTFAGWLLAAVVVAGLSGVFKRD
jgi:transposase